jgi:lauroyl/myristoyl acyltransferase
MIEHANLQSCIGERSLSLRQLMVAIMFLSFIRGPGMTIALRFIQPGQDARKKSFTHLENLMELGEHRLWMTRLKLK